MPDDMSDGEEQPDAMVSRERGGVDGHVGSPETAADERETIKQRLGLDRSAGEIAAEIQTGLEAFARSDMFGPGGLCSGFLLRPMSDRYFVAHEFRPTFDDLRAALTDALKEFGVLPVSASEFHWQGHILCKVSALIQCAPFGVYQLTVSQNRNVYLELGIAVGLGRPFVLVRDRGAELPPLIHGLDYFNADSYLELRYRLGHQVRPFLVNIATLPQRTLPSAGSRPTAVIAHGDQDVLDFCMSMARVVSAFKLTPVFISDPTQKLSEYLALENIPHEILGAAGQTKLDEALDAIQSAHVGVYRIDGNAAPASFLALGMAIGLNRPGCMVYKSGDEPPSDVRGLGALSFDSYSGLKKSFPEVFAKLLTGRT